MTRRLLRLPAFIAVLALAACSGLPAAGGSSSCAASPGGYPCQLHRYSNT